MSAIMIKCPETGQEFSIGIDTDESSFAQLPKVSAATRCPACGKTHEWTVGEAWLQKRETTQRPG